MIDLNQVELAKQIATEAHQGQKRWNGAPYIVHPEAVTKLVKKECANGFHESEKEIMVSAAWLHDVVEDTKMTLQDLRNKGVDEEILEVVQLLTKVEGQEYIDYLRNICNNYYAVIVKMCDIKDNLKDLKKGNMRDKYLLALHFLVNND